MINQRIFITGGNSFIGRRLCRELKSCGYEVITGERHKNKLHSSVEVTRNDHTVYYGDIGPDTMWKDSLKGIDIIVHLAARVHIMVENSRNPLADYMHTNTYATERLIKEAANAGVKRFILMSSIGVNGNSSGRAPFTEDDLPKPHNYYSVSKYEAEKVVKKVSRKEGIESVIIRPPLVYGPEVKANFLTLLRIVNRGYPLPLGALQNQRSYIGLGNLAHFIVCAIKDERAAGETFLISDGEDISTPQLLRKVAQLMGTKIWLPNIPMPLIALMANLAGRQKQLDKLSQSLRVDISKARDVLHWRAPYRLVDGLEETVAWFKDVNGEKAT